MQLKSRDVAAIAIYASLYAATSLLTAYIPTGPYFIQFRPAIAIPMIAAIVATPLIAGLSAAIGTFIASIIRYGTPLLTIFSGTPANFMGFYIMSLAYKVLRRKNVNWIIALIVSSCLGLIVGSAIIALGLWFLASAMLVEGLEKFINLEFAFTASFLLVFAPAPVALVIVVAILKILKNMGKVRL